MEANTLENTTPVNSAVPVVSKKRTYLVDIDHVPWTPFVFPQTFFKLLRIDDANSSVTVMVLAHKDAPTPIHKHVGDAEIYVISGSLSYEEGTAHAGYYLHEAAGTVHIAEAEREVLALVMFKGPLVGYNDDGSVAGICDPDLFYQLAKDNNAVGHLPPRD